MEVTALQLVERLSILLYLISAVKVGKARLTTGNVQDSTFVSEGFSNWKDANRCFSNHEKSKNRKDRKEWMSLCYTKEEERSCWFELGSGIGHHPNTPKDLFHQDCFKCLNMIAVCIHDRFNQPGYGVLKNLEDLLLKATRNENYDSKLDFVLDLYKKDFDLPA